MPSFQVFQICLLVAYKVMPMLLMVEAGYLVLVSPPEAERSPSKTKTEQNKRSSSFFFCLRCKYCFSVFASGLGGEGSCLHSCPLGQVLLLLLPPTAVWLPHPRPPRTGILRRGNRFFSVPCRVGFELPLVSTQRLGINTGWVDRPSVSWRGGERETT